MHLHLSSRLPLALLTALILLLDPRTALAQAKPKEVTFKTADEVDLKGTFYPGTNESSCVLFVHEIGSDRTKGGWEKLAEKLSSDGFAVLSFDLRGHNDSINVKPEIFWGVAANQVFRRNQEGRIDYKDFIKNNKSYLPMLVNDIAAARRYLDEENDNRRCNTSNLILVGAKDGAALASLWMYLEVQRQRTTLDQFGNLMLDPKRRMEGDDLAAAIFLSIPDRLAAVPVSNFLTNSTFPLRDKLPMTFFFGEQDEPSKKAAQSLHRSLQSYSSGKKLMDATKLRSKNSKSAGADLLGKEGLDTEDDIVKYLKTILEKRGERQWTTRDSSKHPPLQLYNLRNYGFAVP